MSTAFVTCPLCEATCGLKVTYTGTTVESVRGDADDVFSAGYLCPKGASLPALHADPDRLRQPLLKKGGRHVPVGWDEAFAAIDAGLTPVLAAHGRDAVALYLGNPAAHNVSAHLYHSVLIKTLGSKNYYSASSVDQMPKHFSSGYMFGHPLSIAIPDIDRTSYLLALGANPLVSNGSIMTAPDVRGRLRRIQERGGRLVVVDPRRSRTAEVADEHVAIRPGTDALLLFAMVHTLFDDDLVSDAVDADGVEDVRALAKDFAPETVAGHVGVPAGDIRRLAHELAAAESAAVYGRIGTSAQEFGTLTSWLVDVLNVLTGNLDRPGGAMFPLASAGQPNSTPGPRRPFRHGRWHSRVRGLPEVIGELPVATLADEILTPGEGQVRALITSSGNPCLSTPHATRLSEAFAQLDFMVSIDVYLNETSRHADVILPGPTPFERPHFDVILYQFAVRNAANFTPALFDSDVPGEWRTILRLIGILRGLGSDTDVDALDDAVSDDLARRTGVEVVAGRNGPERLLDMMLRAGPYDVTLADFEAAPHGIDFGPLQPRLPDLLGGGRVQLAPTPITADVPRLRARLDDAPPQMLLVGRRHLSSNNSWMHNIAPLVKGGNRCTAHVHPEDAARLGLSDGSDALVRSRVGELRVPVEITDTIRPGVVSIPHGWGHGLAGTRGDVARAHAGVNANVLTDDQLLDAPTGTAAFNGVPVEVLAAQGRRSGDVTP